MVGVLGLEAFEADLFEVNPCLHKLFVDKLVMTMFFTFCTTIFVLIVGKSGRSMSMIGSPEVPPDFKSTSSTVTMERQLSVIVSWLT